MSNFDALFELADEGDHVSYMTLVREYLDAIYEVKVALANDDVETARVILGDIPEDQQKQLWKAPSKGGIFTTMERKQIKGG